MLKRVFFVGLLVAGNAIAQDVTVSGKELESGAADAKVAALAQQAAQAGKPVVVNAPAEWHGKIAAKLRAAGVSNVKLNDSFVESAVLRIEDKPVAKAVEPAPAPKPEPVAAAKPVETPKPVEAAKPAPAPVPKPAAPAPAPKPVAAPPPPKPEPQPEPKPEPVPTEPVATAPATEAVAPAASTPAPEPAPVQAPEPAPAPVAPPPAPVAAAPVPAAKPAADNTAAIRQRFERSLNEGRAAEGELKPEQLEKGDVLYVEGGVNAIVRRDRLRTHLYWLNGAIELQRAELNPVADNRYELTEKLRPNISLRPASAATRVFAAKTPDDAERANLQKQYAEGRDVTRSFRAEQLKTGDVLYLGKAAVLVVRRDGTSYVRGWLEGNIDLGQPALVAEGNKVKVVSDKVH